MMLATLHGHCLGAGKEALELPEVERGRHNNDAQVAAPCVKPLQQPQKHVRV